MAFITEDTQILRQGKMLPQLHWVTDHQKQLYCCISGPCAEKTNFKSTVTLRIGGRGIRRFLRVQNLQISAEGGQVG